MSEHEITTNTRTVPSESNDKGIFGFWVYIMTDCVLFASLFASYAVLHNNTFGGPVGRQLFDLHSILIETLALLVSSFTCGLSIIATGRGKLRQTILWLIATFGLGLVFLGLELSEFHHLATTGNSWHVSGFLSAFFTLVGTHGLHITVGLVWIVLLIWQIIYRGLSRGTVRRLTMFSLFWHFLDIIWIFIFTVVYLMAFIKT